ncbi:hypothetical protein L596_024409 [Steinernema carpocapsae]|uniref:Transposase Tc5 C-terminal domain-containing protein n=1 Tax=Steinernema carpocapsae TaxID=34508 RepID=A0A4U5MGL9_STECR|nr:hypothetical protein L596_024409 [Steinernema carpocapsae]
MYCNAEQLENLHVSGTNEYSISLSKNRKIYWKAPSAGVNVNDSAQTSPEFNGYISVKPPTFKTPGAFCFDFLSIIDCATCSEESKIRRAYRSNYYCLNHFVISEHCCI